MSVSSCRSVKENNSYSGRLDSKQELLETLTDSINNEIEIRFKELSEEYFTLDIKNEISEYDSSGRIKKITYTEIKGNNTKATHKENTSNEKTTLKEQTNKKQISHVDEAFSYSSDTEKIRSPTLYIIISVVVLLLIIYFIWKWKS